MQEVHIALVILLLLGIIKSGWKRDAFEVIALLWAGILIVRLIVS